MVGVVIHLISLQTSSQPETLDFHPRLAPDFSIAATPLEAACQPQTMPQKSMIEWPHSGQISDFLLQADLELDVAASENVLNLEFGELGVEA